MCLSLNTNLIIKKSCPLFYSTFLIKQNFILSTLVSAMAWYYFYMKLILWSMLSVKLLCISLSTYVLQILTPQWLWMSVEDNEESGQVMAGTSIASVLRDWENLHQLKTAGLQAQKWTFQLPKHWQGNMLIIHYLAQCYLVAAGFPKALVKSPNSPAGEAWEFSDARGLKSSSTRFGASRPSSMSLRRSPCPLPTLSWLALGFDFIGLLFCREHIKICKCKAVPASKNYS